MWLTMYFFEENILLQSVHCQAACPAADSLFGAGPGFTVSRILTVSAGMRTTGAGPKKKTRARTRELGVSALQWSFGNIELREFPRSYLWFLLTWIPKEFLEVSTFWQNGQE